MYILGDVKMICAQVLTQRLLHELIGGKSAGRAAVLVCSCCATVMMAQQKAPHSTISRNGLLCLFMFDAFLDVLRLFLQDVQVQP